MEKVQEISYRDIAEVLTRCANGFCYGCEFNDGNQKECKTKLVHKYGEIIRLKEEARGDDRK